jgi:hypothetical protein
VRIPVWRSFLACGLAVTAVYFLLPNSEQLTAAGSAAFAYSAAVAVVAGARRHRPPDPWPWYLIAAALLALGTGDAIQWASGAKDLADLCFLATYVLITVALLRLVRIRSGGRDLPALLDALVITTGLGVVSWQFLMFPYASDPSLSLDQKLDAIVLPLADVVLLAVLVRLWSGGGRRQPAYWLLGLSVVALLAADTAFGVVSLRDGFVPGGPIDAGYCLFRWPAGRQRCTPRWPRWPCPARRRRPGGPVGAWLRWPPRPSWPRACSCWNGRGGSRSRCPWWPPAASSCSC